MSATAVRRLAVAAQGYAARYRRATGPAVEAAIRRLSCVQLDSISTVERSHRIALASRVGDYPREAVSRLLARRADLRVLGARGVPAPDRVVAALPAARWRTAAAAGTATSSETHPHLAERDPRRDPRARPARVAPLRGRRRRRDVELEAGEGDAGAALEPRRPRDRRAAGLPAGLRPGRARDPARAARRAGAERARDAAHARGAGRARARRPDRGGIDEHWRLQGRRRRGSGRRSTSSSPRAAAAARGRRRRRRRARRRAAPSSTCPRRAPPCSSRPSTTCSGTGRSRGGSSGSTT